MLTDSEDTFVDPAEWTESLQKTLATQEGLNPTGKLGGPFLREQYARHGSQASVRDMIRHFRKVWDGERPIATCIGCSRAVARKSRVIA